MSAALLVVALGLGADAYPNPKLLIEAADVEIPKDEKSKVRILDARKKADYEAGHVPTAAWVDLEAWGKTIGTENQFDALKRLDKVGIFFAKEVVVYAQDPRDAARLWWFLHSNPYYPRDARVLNGGWSEWKKSDRPIQKEVAPIRSAGDAMIKTPSDELPWRALAEKADVLKAIKDKNAQIIDARSEGEFCGTEKKSKAGGHIPGAVHLEWSDFIDAKTGKFKPPADLKKLAEDRKIDLGKPAITYCQGGGRAAVVAFGLELLGAKDVRNYYKSWGEWGNDPELPVEK